MTAIQVSDYTMTIMKDSDDPYYFSISSFRKAHEEGCGIQVRVLKEESEEYDDEDWLIPESMVCTGGRMMLWFNDKIPETFKKGVKIEIEVILRKTRRSARRK